MGRAGQDRASGGLLCTR